MTTHRTVAFVYSTSESKDMPVVREISINNADLLNTEGEFCNMLKPDCNDFELQWYGKKVYQKQHVQACYSFVVNLWVSYVRKLERLYRAAAPLEGRR